jgi:hypothetical protein
MENILKGPLTRVLATLSMALLAPSYAYASFNPLHDELIHNPSPDPVDISSFELSDDVELFDAEMFNTAFGGGGLDGMIVFDCVCVGGFSGGGLGAITNGGRSAGPGADFSGIVESGQSVGGNGEGGSGGGVARNTTPQRPKALPLPPAAKTIVKQITKKALAPAVGGAVGKILGDGAGKFVTKYGSAGAKGTFLGIIFTPTEIGCGKGEHCP